MNLVTCALCGVTSPDGRFHTSGHLEGIPLSEAATSLGIHPDVLRRQIHRGKLQGQKRIRDWYVTLEEVERYRRESLRK